MSPVPVTVYILELNGRGTLAGVFEDADEAHTAAHHYRQRGFRCEVAEAPFVFVGADDGYLIETRHRLRVRRRKAVPV